MSGTVVNLGAALGLADWTTQLLPASFRGVPFYVRSHEQEAGRRIIESEYPLRDTPSTEDLGRKIEHYQFDAYVLGQDYFAQASALYQACVLQNTTGTLVHPYLGNITARCEGFRRRETDKEGAIARIDLRFIEGGNQASPIALVDTSSASLGWVSGVFSALVKLYSLAVVVANHPGFLLGYLTTQLESAAGTMLGLPGGTLAGFANMVAGITAAPTDTTATPTAITAALAAYADGVAQAPPGTYPNGADLSFGLAGLATFGSTYPAVPLTTPDRIQEAANQTAMVLTVQAGATAALAQVYAQTDFVSANAATTAAAQLTNLIDTLATQAADAGYSDLYAQMIGLYAAVAADMNARAQQLPLLAPYATPDTLPSLVLAQLLYQDPSRAAELESLNDAADPSFMPMQGVALSS